MRIGLTGLPQSGKKTLFSVLTGLDPERNKIGITKVSDPRLDFLASIYRPKKITPHEIEYALTQDITANDKDPVLRSLLNLDAFVFIARAFIDDSVYHVDGTIDAARDITSFVSDLVLRDMMFIEKRIESLKLDIRKKPTDDKKKELAVATRIKEHLDGENLVRTMEFTTDDLTVLSAYQFLTDKKLMAVINFSEGADYDAATEKIKAQVGNPNITYIGLSARVEMEIAGLEDQELKDEFFKEMGITEPACNKMTKLSYDSMDLISFFTAGPTEVRAWSVNRNSPILKAARRIHEDMAKGFIRAEVIKFSDMEKYGSEQKIKEAGVLHLKGKDYTVDDGDIICFRFNV